MLACIALYCVDLKTWFVCCDIAAPLQAERAEIVMGKKEAPPQPKEDEAEETPSATKEEKNNDEEVAAGIPEFWLNVLRNYEDIGKLVRSSFRIWQTASRLIILVSAHQQSKEMATRCP
jgi:hypothetical protein